MDLWRSNLTIPYSFENVRVPHGYKRKKIIPYLVQTKNFALTRNWIMHIFWTNLIWTNWEWIIFRYVFFKNKTASLFRITEKLYPDPCQKAWIFNPAFCLKGQCHGIFDPYLFCSKYSIWAPYEQAKKGSKIMWHCLFEMYSNLFHCPRSSRRLLTMRERRGWPPSCRRSSPPSSIWRSSYRRMTRSLCS